MRPSIIVITIKNNNTINIHQINFCLSSTPRHRLADSSSPTQRHRPLRLPICIHCSHPASTLYRRYTASLIVLVRCGNPECGRVVDSYADEEWRRPPAVRRGISGQAEEDDVEESGGGKAWGSLGISWMDVILVKPRAYRHFLYNIPFLLPPPGHPARNTDTSTNAEDKGGGDDDDDDWSSWKTVAKRFVALSLVDAYLRWFYLCAYPSAPVAGMVGENAAWWTLPALLRQAGALLQPQLSTPSTSSILSLAFWRRHQPSDYKSSLSSFLPPAVASSVDTDSTQGMVMSYLMVWVATAAELLAFHATVTVGSMAWVRWQRARRGREQGLQQRQEVVLGQDEVKEAEKQVDGGSDDASFSFSEASSSTSTSSSSTASDSGPIDHPPPHVTLLDLYRPQLISTALLLSSLSTLLLLSIVLLWESKLPRPGSGQGQGDDRHRHRSSTSAGGPATIGDLLPTLLLSSPLFTTYLPSHLSTTLTTLPLPHLSTDFAVRTLLGGLSAGVCLAVVHPREPLLTTSLLLVGWTVASGGVRGRWTLLPGEAGPGGGQGVGVEVGWELGRARGLYCAM